jgi:hypothetical protein
VIRSSFLAGITPSPTLASPKVSAYALNCSPLWHEAKYKSDASIFAIYGYVLATDEFATLIKAKFGRQFEYKHIPDRQDFSSP